MTTVKSEIPIHPPVFLLLSIMVMLLLKGMIPSLNGLSFPWNLAGLLPLGLGITLNLAADHQFKEVQTTVKPREKSSCLVTDGVFKITRNPMYLGMVLILLGIATLVGSWIAYLVIPGFAALMICLYIQMEERQLESQFGEVWRVYRKNTPRWI